MEEEDGWVGWVKERGRRWSRWETTFTSEGACRHNGGVVGRGLDLCFTGGSFLCLLAWAWCEWWEWVRTWIFRGVEIVCEGKSGFVSHTKHIAEATNLDLFHSWLITCIMWFSKFEYKIAYLGVMKFKTKD